jgi:hypothetical protein
MDSSKNGSKTGPLIKIRVKIISTVIYIVTVVV